MTKYNYKSDFDFVLWLTDCKGNKMPFPQCDWHAYFWTADPYRPLKASCSNGACHNCFRQPDGAIHFVFDHRHGLLPGKLHWEPHFDVPNEIYPDGLQHLCWPESLDIELVSGRGDCATETVVEVMAPYIKGEPFTYADFTPEQIAELQKPATDTAASVSVLETNIQETEALRKDAEQTRISNENSRTSAENDRVRDENIRKANETSRQADETSRQSQETARVEAEQNRANEFATWQGEIDSKADRTELSNVIAEEPLTPDNFTDISTYTREELKKDLFVDMWDSAWGQYGKYDPVNAPDAEHPYMGNDIWMTYEEALTVHRESSGANYLCDYCHPFATARTFYPVRNSHGSWGNNATFAFGRCANLEVIRFEDSVYIGVGPTTFGSCNKLRTILGGKLRGAIGNTLNLPNIEEFKADKIDKDVSMPLAAKVSLESLQYLVANAANTSAITITVHPDVYAKLSDETNAEWHALMAAAAAKNINFATTN